MIFISNIQTKKNYKIGLSLIGIVAVILIMLPNTVYLFYTPLNDVLSSNESSYWFWNILENIGRFGLMITLCFVINKTAPTRNRVATITAIYLLIAYYVLWIAYFIGTFNGVSLFGMALFPSAFFFLIAWRQRNVFALVFVALFAIVHISITSINFLF